MLNLLKKKIQDKILLIIYLILRYIVNGIPADIKMKKMNTI